MEQNPETRPTCQDQDCPCPQFVRNTAPCHPAPASPASAAPVDSPAQQNPIIIDGQAFPLADVAEYCEMQSLNPWMDAAAEYLHRLEAALAASTSREQQVREAWIPVGERLPEDGKAKIVAALTEMSPGRFRHITLKRTFYYDEEQKGWIRNGQGDGDGKPTTHNITHYMHLPPPPAASLGIPLNPQA